MSGFASANPSAGEKLAVIDDLLRQILLPLPAKTLISFKLVSKRWLSIISDPEFAQSHLLTNPSPPPSGMFLDTIKPWKIDFFFLGDDVNTDKQSKPSFDFLNNAFRQSPFDYGEVCVLQSCNGLFLCRSIDYAHLCVCNPTTNQYRLIPTIGGLSNTLGFAFDPSISPHYYVTCEHYALGYTYSRVEVYSSKVHEWRLLHEFNEFETNEYELTDHVYYDGGNGVLWLGHKSFCFDLDTDTLVQRPRPSWFSAIKSMLSSPTSVYLDKVVGVKDKYVYKMASGGEKLYVYGMSGDYSEWVVNYSLCVSRLTSVYPEIVTTKRFNGLDDVKFAVWALGVVEGLREEDTVLILAIPDKIISYNFVRETVKTVYDFPAEPAEKINIRAFPFIETLSPV